LNGVTGSGKTAVYLNYLQQVISNHRDAQVLILLPEINLTPQLERRIASHMPNHEMAVLHSGLSDKQRARAWYAATTGKAKVILGTRLSILTPIPNLATIVVDEEHDSSFKQQEGLGYSARDLAIWRAKNESIPILLCSATPSLETWHAIERGRYQEIKLSERIHQAQMPIVELIQTQQANSGAMISNVLKQALQNNFQEGRQALIFVNRRGFAPALSCGSCAWLSECPECSGFMVMHKQLGSRKSPVLCCHHCGLIKSVPRSCPKCGDSDLLPLGRGTQKIEEQIGEIIPQAKVLRVDADTARTGKLSEELFTKIHQGEADIIVGTQMLSKGHDYQNIGLVCVLDADARLYSNDYRAPETLFAQLVQVAGRAGRSGGEQAKMLIETRYPSDPVYQYLRNYDLAGFMKHLLKERQDSRLPPYVSQALVHAQSTHMADSLSFLAGAKVHIEKNNPNQGRLVCFDPVPKALAKVAGKERAQLLIEAESRTQLQTQLNALDEFLRKQSTGRITKQGKVRWSIERDPLLI
jgi:primosomal protein N' (replication factor Y)